MAPINLLQEFYSSDTVSSPLKSQGIFLKIKLGDDMD
jgi:hypothetical protein